jgi:transketolase
LQKAAELVPGLVGGAGRSRDVHLCTRSRAAATWDPDAFEGRNLHFGVREHAMGGDRERDRVPRALPSVRLDVPRVLGLHARLDPLSALSKIPVIHVFTHDSIFVGEDGPTHEPIEHTASLRLIPNLTSGVPPTAWKPRWRGGWRSHGTDGPSALILLPAEAPADRAPRCASASASFDAAAYLLAGTTRPHAIVAATGSELHLAVGAREVLAKRGLRAERRLDPVRRAVRQRKARTTASVCSPPACPSRRSRPVAPIRGARSPGALVWPWGSTRTARRPPGSVVGEQFGFTVAAVASKLDAWLTAMRSGRT